MIGFNPVLTKLALMRPTRVPSGDESAMVIPDDAHFTSEEIEELRHDDEMYMETTGNHIIANFMPDETRPAWVPRL